MHVPYERCFVLGDPDLCNGFYAHTSAVVHMTHQVVTRTTAKTEYILGLVSLLTQAIGIEQFQHVQADVAEVITTLETLRALLRAAEADAALNEFGVLTPAWAPLNTARILYPRLYQRFPEILRKLGASGLMATPTWADVTGPAAADIETYLQSATLGGAERVRLFRLVWDTCISAFSGRQALYEYYFFGDPVRIAAPTSPATTASPARPPSARSWTAGNGAAKHPGGGWRLTSQQAYGRVCAPSSTEETDDEQGDGDPISVAHHRCRRGRPARLLQRQQPGLHGGCHDGPDHRGRPAQLRRPGPQDRLHRAQAKWRMTRLPGYPTIR